jgi:hypothetical protein
MMGINLATAQTVIEGKLLVLTLNDEARPGDGRMVKNQELFDLFQEFEVTDFEQAMPFARSPLLRKVYGLEFTGNHAEFLAKLETDYSEFITDILEFYEPVYNFEPEDGLWKSNELWHLKKIQADSAWDISKGDSTVLIAILDSPVDGYHPDLITDLAYLYDPYTEESLVRMPKGTTIEHGTIVASFASAQTSETAGEATGKPLASIGFKTKLLSYGGMAQTVTGVHASTVMGAQVINASAFTGSYLDSEATEEILYDWIREGFQEILDNGTVIVAAAGNIGGQGPPSGGWNGLTFNDIIVVSGTDPTDHFRVYDSLGQPSSFSHYLSVDLCAPGRHMYGATGTLYNDTIDIWPYYHWHSGTSFAAPIVAGTAALIKSINPCLTPATVQHILKTTTDSIADAHLYPYRIGTGRLNAYRAVKLAQESYSPKNYTINTGQSIVWNDVKFIDTLWIKPGATLTINKDCFFNENGVVIVDTSAKLVVNDATLTTSCRNMWYGIQVWGNKNRSQLPYGSQYAQGRVYLENATIENAKEAVRLWKPFDYNSTGGIVMARNTTFRNNRRAVEFISYQNFHPYSLDPEPNFSRFFNCTFDVNDDYIGMGENYIPFHGFVSMWEVDGVRFEGCDFANNKTTLYTEDGELIDSELAGFGLLTIDGGFSVRPYTADQVVDSCHFDRLKYGIKASTALLKNTFEVWQSSFKDNITGIYTSNVGMPAIVKNSFLINAGIMNQNTDTVLFAGVYLDNMTTAYIVEENNFSSTTGIAYIQNDKSIGICINNSGSDNNKLYNNQFEDLFIGVLAQNQNRDRTGDFGLEIKCNRFYNLQYDIAVTAENYSSVAGIKFNQGSGANDVTAPAGNQFAMVGGYPLDAWDLYWNNRVNQIHYWYHANQGNYHLKPDSISVFFAYTSPNIPAGTFSQDSSCPSNFTGSGGNELRGLYVNQLNNLNDSIESTTSLLALLVDGGNTEGTKDMVENAWPDETMEVRDDLMAKSPYLSDEVMLSAVKQQVVLPSVIVTEILVANPHSAKSDTLLNEFFAREDVTNSQLDEVEVNRMVTGAKESLESKLTGYRGKRDYSLSQLIHSYYTDTLMKNPNDSVITLLQPLEYPTARYKLAEALFHKKDFQQAIDVLDDLAEEQSIFGDELEQHNQFRSMYAWWQTVHNSGKNLFSLTESDLTTLQGIYTQSAGKARAMTHNMIIALGLIDYQEPYILPEPELKNEKVRPRKAERRIGVPALNVFPNPAKEYMIIECVTESIPSTKMLQILDSNGKLVMVQNLDRLSGYSVVDLRQLPAGVYMGNVVVDGKLHSTIKVILNR